MLGSGPQLGLPRMASLDHSVRYLFELRLSHTSRVYQ